MAAKRGMQIGRFTGKCTLTFQSPYLSRIKACGQGFHGFSRGQDFSFRANTLSNPLASTNRSCYTRGMAKKLSVSELQSTTEQPPGYDEVLAGISELLTRGCAILRPGKGLPSSIPSFRDLPYCLLPHCFTPHMKLRGRH